MGASQLATDADPEGLAPGPLPVLATGRLAVRFGDVDLVRPGSDTELLPVPTASFPWSVNTDTRSILWLLVPSVTVRLSAVTTRLA